MDICEQCGKKRAETVTMFSNTTKKVIDTGIYCHFCETFTSDE